MPDQLVDASSPEAAAAAALGEKAIRGGQSVRRLLCRVYWPDSGGRQTMVRLYRPIEADEMNQVGGLTATGEDLPFSKAMEP